MYHGNIFSIRSGFRIGHGEGEVYWDGRIGVISFSRLLLRLAFSRRLRNRRVRMNLLNEIAKPTLSLLLAHDGCGVLLGLLELCARHCVLRLLLESQPCCKWRWRLEIGGINEPKQPPSSGPWPDRYRAGYPASLCFIGEGEGAQGDAIGS